MREPGRRQLEFFEGTSHLQLNHKTRGPWVAPLPLVVPVNESQFKARPPLPGRRLTELRYQAIGAPLPREDGGGAVFPQFPTGRKRPVFASGENAGTSAL